LYNEGNKNLSFNNCSTKKGKFWTRSQTIWKNCLWYTSKMQNLMLQLCLR